MPNRFEEAAKKAAQITDDQLKNELNQIKEQNRKKLNELIPTLNTKDKKAFNELIKLVNADTDMDEKLAGVHDSLKSVFGISLKILKVLV